MKTSDQNLTSQTWSVRKATAADAHRLALITWQILYETGRHHVYKLPHVLRGVEKVLSDPAHGEYLVAEADGCYRGQLKLVLHWHDLFDENVATIEHVFVHPKFRSVADAGGWKVYDALHQYAIERCRQQNVPQLQLHVVSDNLRAQRAYQRRNFKPTGLWMTQRLN